MYDLQFSNGYDEIIAKELRQFISFLDGYLHMEHDEDGRHRFPDFTEGSVSFEETIFQILDRYQAKGQFWKYGPWLFNDASDFRAGRAWLRPPNPAAGTYNNYAPVGIDTAVVLELEPAGDITITGLKTREGYNENRLLIIRNRDSSASITIKHEDSNSIAQYRFDVTGGTDIVLADRQTAWCLYDTGRERWSTIITGQSTGPVGSGNALDAQMEIHIGDGVNVVNTGQHYIYTRVPWNFTATAVQVVSDVSTSTVIDLWKDTYANFPPTNADSIVASAKPTLSSAVKSLDSTLTGWDTSWVKDERVEVEVESNTAATKLVISVYGTRST